MARSTLAVRFTGDASDLKRSVGQVDKGLGGLKTSAGKFSTAFKSALTVGAGAAAIKFGKDSVAAFAESEEAQAQLNAAYAKFPALAGGNADSLRALNEELARKTKFDDDATASGQAVLAQFDLTEDQLKRLTPLMQDYAERTGKDLPTAAADLGKAVKGQGRALKVVGVNFKDTGTAAGNFEQLVSGLDKKVGGLAETAGGTTSGKLKILGNQFGELQETVGAKLVPALLALASVLLGIVDFIGNLSPGVQTAIGVLAALAAVVFVVVKAVKAWQAAQLALNVVLNANPIGLIIIAIAAFVAALVIAYQKVGWFRAFVDKSFAIVKAVIVGVFNWVKQNWPLLLAILTGPIGLAVLAITKNWDKIKAGVTAVKDWIVRQFNAVTSFLGGLPGKVGAAASAIWNALKRGLKEAVDWIIRQIDRALGPIDEIAGKLGGLVGKIGDVAGSIGGALGSIPGFASGVNNFRGGLAVVGEDGPELVRLPRGSDVIPNSRLRGGTATSGGNTYVTVHVAGSVLAERDLIATINKALGKGLR